jgi:hypothetical protein
MSSSGSPEGISQLFKELDEIASELEEERRSHVILLIFHDDAYITREVVDDMEFFLEKHNLTAVDKNVDVILHTRGGDADAAYHLGILLQELMEREGGEDKKLTFIIPRLAKSAGTLLACSGDEIAMTPISELGPVDPQVYVQSSRAWVSARVVRDSFGQTLEILREKVLKDAIEIVSEAPGISEAVSSVVKSFTEAALSGIPVMEFGHYDSLIDHVRSLLIELLSKRMFRKPAQTSGQHKSGNVEEVIEKIADKLVRGYRYHGKVIHLKEAEDLGLKIHKLSARERELVNSLYMKIRELFNTIAEIVFPVEIVMGRAPSVTTYQLGHGLIYAPRLEA